MVPPHPFRERHIGKNNLKKELPMNRKSIFSLILILLLAAVSIFGLPFMTHKIEQHAESLTPTVTATPQPNDD